MLVNRQYRGLAKNRGVRLHLRIEDARIRLHNSYRLIERLKSIRRALSICHHSGKIQFQILGM